MKIDKIEEFKIKNLVELLALETQLKQKYSEKADRIEYIISLLQSKLSTLHLHSLSDYLFTLYLASQEFNEFKELIPSRDEIMELLEE
ncbi:MAG: hypothetical protein QXD36_06835 [Sulfolobales archaeon]